MGVLWIILILLAVVLLPVVLFFGLIGLGLFVWSWRRIGPYFVDFGRWIGNWRNYVPCGCLLFGGIVFLMLAAAILPQGMDILRIILLVLVIAVFSVCSIFAVVIWSVRLGWWIWPRFRNGFWEYVERLWNMLSRGVSGESRAEARRPGKGRRPSTTGGGDEAAAAGTRTVAPKPAAGVAPAARRSRLDLSWLWALSSGKPQTAAGRPKLVAKSPERPVRPAAIAEPTEPPRVPSKPRAGLRPLTWRLGLLGRGPRRGGKPRAAAVKVTAETPDKAGAPAAAIPSQPRPSVAVPAPKLVEAKAKPTIVVRPKPRLKGVGGVGRSIADVAEAARKGFWGGVFWTVRKARGGVDSILRLLHLRGKRR